MDHTYFILLPGVSFEVALPANSKPQTPQKESSPTYSYSSDADSKLENTSNKGRSALETELAYVYSDDESKSPHASPKILEAVESLSQKYSDDHFRNSFEADAETQRRFDEPSWGTFVNNDDIDSVWGFNVKDSYHEKHGEKYFFDSNDSGVSPSRTGSPRTDVFQKNDSGVSPSRTGSPRTDVFQKSSLFTFEDSVPGSPLSMAGISPYNAGASDPFFDSLSRYDSVSTSDRVSSPQRETLTSLDCTKSTRGFDHSWEFSFDDTDPFGSTAPFKQVYDGMKILYAV